MPPAQLFRDLPERPVVHIELPRWSLVKRGSDGRIDFISPLPCPYNYGCIPHLASGDGDPLDVVVLGPRLPEGQILRLPVVGIIDFIDAGRPDPKVVCSALPLSAADRAGLIAFFAVYARCKALLARIRGRKGETRSRGFFPERAWQRAAEEEEEERRDVA
jgi:inorganic pyrophosphatase